MEHSLITSFAFSYAFSKISPSIIYDFFNKQLALLSIITVKFLCFLKKLTGQSLFGSPSNKHFIAFDFVFPDAKRINLLADNIVEIPRVIAFLLFNSTGLVLEFKPEPG